MSALNQLPHSGLQRQHSQQICDRRAVFSYDVGHLLLRQSELVDEPLVALGLLERVEIGALEILDERQGEHRPVVEVSDDGGDLGPAEPADRAQATLTSDELPLAVASCT